MPVTQATARREARGRRSDESDPDDHRDTEFGLSPSESEDDLSNSSGRLLSSPAADTENVSRGLEHGIHHGSLRAKFPLDGQTPVSLLIRRRLTDDRQDNVRHEEAPSGRSPQDQALQREPLRKGKSLERALSIAPRQDNRAMSDHSPGPSSRGRRATRKSAAWLQRAYMENALLQVENKQQASEKRDFEQRQMLARYQQKIVDFDRTIEAQETRNRNLQSENHKLQRDLTDIRKHSQKNEQLITQIQQECESLKEKTNRVLNSAEKERRGYIRDNRIAAMDTSKLVRSLLRSVEEMREVKRQIMNSAEEWKLVEEKAVLYKREDKERVRDIKRAIDSVIEEANIPADAITDFALTSGVDEVESALQALHVTPIKDQKRARRKEKRRARKESAKKRGNVPIKETSSRARRKKAHFKDYRALFASSIVQDLSSSSDITSSGDSDSSTLSLIEDSSSDNSEPLRIKKGLGNNLRIEKGESSRSALTKNVRVSSSTVNPTSPIFRPPRLRATPVQTPPAVRPEYRPDAFDLTMEDAPPIVEDLPLDPAWVVEEVSLDPTWSLADELEELSIIPGPMNHLEIAGCVIYQSTRPPPVTMEEKIITDSPLPCLPSRKRRRRMPIFSSLGPDPRYGTQTDKAKQMKVRHNYLRLKDETQEAFASTPVESRRLALPEAPLKPVTPSAAKKPANIEPQFEPQNPGSYTENSLLGRVLESPSRLRTALTTVLIAGRVPMWRRSIAENDNTEVLRDNHALDHEEPINKSDSASHHSLSLSLQRIKREWSMPGMWPKEVQTNIEGTQSLERILQKCARCLVQLLRERPRTVIYTMIGLVAVMSWLWHKLESRSRRDWETSNAIPAHVLSQLRSTRMAEMRWINGLNYELARWLDYDRARIG